MIGSAQYNDLIGLNCTKLLSKSRNYHSLKADREKPKVNNTLKNWITLNKSQFLAKNSLFHRRAASLGQKPHEQVKTVEINFKNPKNKKLSLQPKTRCDSSGSVGSHQSKNEEQGKKNSLNKFNFTDEKKICLSSQIFQSRYNPQKSPRINQIKGLKLQSTGYRVRKVELGPSSFCIRGTKIK